MGQDTPTTAPSSSTPILNEKAYEQCHYYMKHWTISAIPPHNTTALQHRLHTITNISQILLPDNKMACQRKGVAAIKGHQWQEHAHRKLTPHLVPVSKSSRKNLVSSPDQTHQNDNIACYKYKLCMWSENKTRKNRGSITPHTNCD